MSIMNIPLGAHTMSGGVATFTGSATTVFNIPHGLGVTPTIFNAVAGNALAAALLSVTADAKNVIVTYAAGLTGSVILNWSAVA